MFLAFWANFSKAFLAKDTNKTYETLLAFAPFQLF
jgi:hypothetical protein